MMQGWQNAPIILASGSASRRAMLETAGISFDVITSEVDEAAIKAQMLDEAAGSAAICAALAKAKAEAVSALRPDCWVIGGDSVVSVNGQMFSKPRSLDEAADHLRAFSGRQLRLDSAVVLARGGRLQSQASDFAELNVRTLSAAFIAQYLAVEWPAIGQCVGCFRIEGPGVHMFDQVTGSHFTILGMPLLPLLALLRSKGILTA